MARMLRRLEKVIRFERGVPDLSENLCEMAEATDSPVVMKKVYYTCGGTRLNQ